LKTLFNAWRIKDVRKKMMFTIVAIIIARIGTYITLPFINKDLITAFTQSSALSFVNAMTGGALSNMSIFALNITPYITASIVIQVLGVAIPRLAELQKEGEYGKKQIKKYTFYITIVLAFVQSITMAIAFNKKGYLTPTTAMTMFIAIATIVLLLTVSSVFLMWLGEQITEKGIGQGVSVILAVNIFSKVPSDLFGLFNKFINGKPIPTAIGATIIIVGIIVALIVFIAKLEASQTRIPIQHATRIQNGVKNQDYTFMPLKTNMAGVMPVIFASSLMQIPIFIASVTGKGNGSGVGAFILKMFNQNSWFNISSTTEFKYTFGVILYLVLILFFSYFYKLVIFNPDEIADNLKKSNAIIPGVRPGKETSEHIANISKKATLKGAIGVSIIVLIPAIVSGIFHANVSFGGTSLIIIVSVAIMTYEQLKALSIQGQYTTLVKDYSL